MNYKDYKNYEDCKMEKSSLCIRGHRTSIALEKTFMDSFRLIAKERGSSLAELAHEIDMYRGTNSFARAARVFIINYYKC